MKRIRSLIAASLVVSCFIPAGGSAEERRSGRLPDGRAYRTDTQGLQLVDHIAELEVSVRELNSQVQKLEFELAEKDRQLLNRGGSIAPAASPGNVSCDAQVAPYRSRVSELERKVLEYTSATPTTKSTTMDVAAQLRPFEERVRSQQSSIEQQRLEIADLREQLQRAQQSTHAEVGGAQAVTKQYQRELASRDEQLQRAESAKQRLEGAVAKSEERLASIESEAKRTAGEVARLNAEVESYKRREQELLARLDGARESAASQKIAATPTQRARPVQTEKVQAVTASVQKELKSALSEIQMLITKRKDLFDSLKSKQRGVTIGLQPLVTKRGVSLDALRTRVGESDPSSIGILRQGLSEIESLLRDDIKTIQRLIS